MMVFCCISCSETCDFVGIVAMYAHPFLRFLICVGPHQSFCKASQVLSVAVRV